MEGTNETQLSVTEAMEKFQVPDDPNELIKRSKELSKEVAEVKEKLNKTLDELKEEEDRVRTRATTLAVSLVEEDKRKLASLFAKIEEMKSANSGLSKKISSMFRTGFSSGPSKTVEVACKKTDGDYDCRPAITFGKNGFGMRRNKQSQALKYDEVIVLVKRKDEVLDGLKDVGAMDAYAKFKAFTDIVTEKMLDDDNDTVLESLVEKVVSGSKIYGKVRLEDDSNWRGRFHMRLLDDEFDAERLTMDDRMDALVYLQVRDELIARAPEFEVKVQEKINETRQALDKIQALFAKELMLAEL